MWLLASLMVACTDSAEKPDDADPDTRAACLAEGVDIVESPDGYDAAIHLRDDWLYTADGRPLTHVRTGGDANAWHESYTWDEEANLLSLDTWFGAEGDRLDAETTTWTWDADGHLLMEDVAGSDATVHKSTAYTWDGDRLLSEEASTYGEPWSTTTYAYDEAGDVLAKRVVFVTDAAPLEWDYTWDDAGHELGETYADAGPGHVTSYEYDAAWHEITAAIDGGAETAEDADGVVDEWWRYSWDGDHLVLWEDEYPEGTIRRRASYTYGDDGRLAHESREHAADGGWVADYTADYAWSDAACP
jgi:hypothetical protein